MIRLNLSASFIVLGLALATATATAAEPDIHFYPAKIWNVASSASSLAGASVHNCTITNEFNNGFIVQLSGSHQWVEALQIDFRQPAFTPGKNYTVNLGVPGLSSKTVNGQAANESQMVVNLRGQKDIYEAMRDSSVFDLGIDGNQFRFYMIGFDQSAEGFERCMSGGQIETAIAVDRGTHMSINTAPTYNEAIAFEDAEKSGAEITDVIPPAPQPEIEMVDAPAYEDMFEPDSQSRAAAAPLDLRAAKEGDTRQRLTDMIAQEIEENPDIADPSLDMSEMNKEPLADMSEDIFSKIQVAESNIEQNAPPIVISPPTQKEEAAPEQAIEAAPKENIQAEEPREIQPAPKNDIIRVAAADPRKAQSGLYVAPSRPKAVLNTPVVEEIDIETEDMASDVNAENTIEEMDVEVAEIEIETPPAIEPQHKMAAEELLEEPQKSLIPEPARAKVTKTVESMEADFTELYEEPAAVEPAAFNDETRSDPEMARKLSELEQTVFKLQKENEALNDDLEHALSESRDEQMSISNENWNLERATKQFQEAERQLKRLGQQLQQERTACSVEKRELETMLFDPSLTEDAQMAKLNQLEEELANTQAQLKALRGQ
ncbi:MAG: hypothetical protein KDJ35_04300 [Alphaproteobacteria bacterium]|nr:hypothetical protein [Alphaproteobacteria bacterium]